MVCKIAIAKEGFIDIKDNYNVDSVTSFEQMFTQLFKVEDKDLLGFDGVSCTLEVLKDPTNSVFIYKNDTGNFLYQIQRATPLIHKNQMLWTCTVALLEDLDLLNEITQQQTIDYFVTRGLSNSALNESIKDNFKPILTQVTNLNYGLGTLKLKFMVNPTTLDLTTNESDGSFVFVFPLMNRSNPSLAFNNKISTTNNELYLKDILSKYSNNLKSIEFLPFLLNSDSKGNSFTATEVVGSGEYSLLCTLSNTSMWTDAGIFLSDSAPMTQRPITFFKAVTGDPFQNIADNIFFNSIVLGGAFKVFLRTPLANIPLTTNLSTYSKQEEDTAHRFSSSVCFARCNTDGWLIDGMFRQSVPAHYLNFYTDSSGNIFIQNMTTNALAFKELERDYELNERMVSYNRSIEDMRNVAGLGQVGIGSLASGQSGALGVLNFSIDQLERGKSRGFEDIMRAEQYRHAVGKLQRQIENEKLLAKFTGKQIAGNVSLYDFLQYFNGNFFAIVLESNIDIKKSGLNGFVFKAQKDYDYSCQVSKNKSDTFVNAIKDIFSLDTFEEWRFSKGLNYQCVFKFSYYNLDNNRNATSLLLNIPVRNPNGLQTVTV